MQTLVFVLMLLVCFNFLLKQTYNKRWAVGITTLACALWTGLSWPYAILQSKTQIADWLANPALMLDTSVILSVEICMQLAFCLLAVHLMTGGTVPRRTLWIYRFLRWFPGLLIFPVLFSGLVALIFSFPGTSFSLLAWSMAGGVLLGIPLCTVLLRRLPSGKGNPSGTALSDPCADCHSGNRSHRKRKNSHGRNRRRGLEGFPGPLRTDCCRRISRPSALSVPSV